MCNIIDKMLLYILIGLGVLFFIIYRFKKLNYSDLEEVRPGYYICKTQTGYIRIYPIYKEINMPASFNNIHWKNFIIGGSWINLLIFFLIFFLIFSYFIETSDCREFMNNPYPYCRNYCISPSNYTFIDSNDLIDQNIILNQGEVLT